MAARCPHMDLTTELRRRTEGVGAARISEWEWGKCGGTAGAPSWVLGSVLNAPLLRTLICMPAFSAIPL